MKKSILTAVLLHGMAVFFIWIGFPVTHVKDNLVFYYGQLLAPVASRAIFNDDKVPIKADTVTDGGFWYKIRAMDKPKR